MGNIDEKEKIIKQLDSILMRWNHSRAKAKKAIKKKTKTLLQQSAFLSDTDLTDNDDPIEKRIPQNHKIMNFFYPDIYLVSTDNHEQAITISMNIFSSTSEKKNLIMKIYKCKFFMKNNHG